MIDLPDPSSLRTSVSNGPESWTEAWSKVAETTDETMRLVENITATEAGRYDAYQSYIDEVQEVTGVTLRNPLDVDLQTDTYDQKTNPTYGFGSGVEFREERLRVAREQFDAERAALAARYPAQARLIQFDLDGRVNRQMQDAERAAIDAATSPELGLAGRLSAQIFGGLKGSARDPYQWAMSMFGAGAGTGPTVAARIGKIMVTEALLNGGQEALLQAASQERKKRAGLEHGMKDALANVGIAATFGALFGGTIQGGAELARIFKLGEGGAEQAARVLEGRPEPGDVETLAKAMNVELGPQKLDMISRSFDESALDQVTIPADASPSQLRVLEAAQRHAADPDSFPPPELVERMLAAEDAGRPIPVSPEQMQRAMAGDVNAIDELSDALDAVAINDAANVIGSATTRIEAVATRIEDAVQDLPPLVDPARLDAIAQQKVPVGRKPPAPQSLMDFIAGEGGIRADGGELRALGLERKFVPGRGALVRQSGQSLDYAREAAAQAGYFNHLYGTADEAAARSTIADLLDLLDQESRGTRATSAMEAERASVFAAYDERLRERADYREFLGRLESALREVAPEAGIDEGVLARATDLMIEEDLTPLAAFDRAVLEDEARLGDFADEIGEGYRNEPDYADIPFFDEPAAAVAGTRGIARAPDADGDPGARGATAANGNQSQGPGEAARDGIDPFEGQAIAPPVRAEPMEDAAMRAAEEQAGEILDPVLDQNGNPESLLDFIPVEDGEGNVRLVSTRQALEEAEKGAFLADLLEACKL